MLWFRWVSHFLLTPQTAPATQGWKSPVQEGLGWAALGIYPPFLGIYPHSLGIYLHSLGVLSHSLGIYPHSLGVYPPPSLCSPFWQREGALGLRMSPGSRQGAGGSRTQILTGIRDHSLCRTAPSPSMRRNANKFRKSFSGCVWMHSSLLPPAMSWPFVPQPRCHLAPSWDPGMSPAPDPPGHLGDLPGEGRDSSEPGRFGFSSRTLQGQKERAAVQLMWNGTESQRELGWKGSQKSSSAIPCHGQGRLP